MKLFSVVFLLCLLNVGTYAQNREILYSTYGEENSEMKSSTCYNWNQLPNGELFVSGNSGLYRFDGVHFEHFNAKGRGNSISSSEYDQSGRLWCNTFNGDIYFMHYDSLHRHQISDSLKELTFFHRVGGHFYLRTEQRLYEVDRRTKKIKLIGQFPLIRTIFEYEGVPYLLYGELNANPVIQNLKDHSKKSIDFPFSIDSRCQYLPDTDHPMLFFIDSKKFVLIDELMLDKSLNPITIKHDEKINYTIQLDDKIAVCGVDGIHFYDLKGKWLRQILPNYQVTHFGKDQEGNYIATTNSEGLIVIPNIDATKFSFTNYLDHEHIIQSIFDTKDQIYLGTSAGKILKQNIQTGQTQTCDLGLRSEVVSMELSNDRKKLYVYCEVLHVIDVESFRIERKFEESSIKQMVFMGETLYQGTRKGLMTFKNGKFENLDDLGWTISMLPFPKRNQLLLSTKKGLFTFFPETKRAKPIILKGINHDLIISNLQTDGKHFYFLYNQQKLYRCNLHFQHITLIYDHQNNELNGFNLLDEYAFLTTKGKVIVLDKSGKIIRVLRENSELNEGRTVAVLKNKQGFYFVHKQSISRLPRLSKSSSIIPNLRLKLLSSSSFSKQKHILLSSFKNNVLAFKLIVSRGIRLKGNLKVWYQLENSGEDWKVIDNPYEEIRLERLPVGQGVLRFKVSNDLGSKSSILAIQYRVDPPFYLTGWFITLMALLLIGIVLLLIRWNGIRIRRKALARLKKQQLESRALNAELTAIRSQMNPHFIFNVLTAIQAKVIQGKVDEAYTNIGDFAILIRNILDKSGKEFISLDDEIALMKNYVELENSRLTIPIQFVVVVDDEEYFEDIIIPTLITQPIIENSIKHAFPGSSSDKKIVLNIKRIVNGFQICISDNGIGTKDIFVPSDISHQPFALSALRKRIQSLSLSAPYTVDIDLESSDLGTNVTFTFNYKTS